ncbi:hypothetical protein [Hymenobacter qilianensis]|uniref:Uncharacterized protein n=1 Tax=Hymenobacter qilianensis TaxID=1385715 RepID=A0A7H0GTA0_9BACT|nr:hypothetical protein [Hymenobacter qilianensis]QNP51516.1 hypothetical protein H9L05_16120 [Hymenobacter qilianensis]
MNQSTQRFANKAMTDSSAGWMIATILGGFFTSSFPSPSANLGSGQCSSMKLGVAIR